MLWWWWKCGSFAVVKRAINLSDKINAIIFDFTRVVNSMWKYFSSLFFVWNIRLLNFHIIFERYFLQVHSLVLNFIEIRRVVLRVEKRISALFRIVCLLLFYCCWWWRLMVPHSIWEMKTCLLPQNFSGMFPKNHFSFTHKEILIVSVKRWNSKLLITLNCFHLFDFIFTAIFRSFSLFRILLVFCA